MSGQSAHPYEGLPSSAFWKTAVSNVGMFDIRDVWVPKFPISPKHKVATFGSCFAQNIGGALRDRGYSWLISEEAPRAMSRESRKRFNYDVFTCRTGAIYTCTLLRQWISWASGETSPPDEIWERDDRFIDPFRPRIEPGGFDSRDELMQSRTVAIEAFRHAVEKANVFVFTLGLTESWWNTAGGYEYPLCPGTVAGEYSAARHGFRNQSFGDIRQSLAESVDRLRRLNPKIRVLLTVSPTPLTATASGRHVLAATMLSKSVLRAVADDVANHTRDVDYFPSFELVFSPPFRATFFGPNMRDVTAQGVDFIMTTFFDAQAAAFGDAARPGAPAPERRPRSAREDLACEERLLEAFGGE